MAQIGPGSDPIVGEFRVIHETGFKRSNYNPSIDPSFLVRPRRVWQLVAKRYKFHQFDNFKMYCTAIYYLTHEITPLISVNESCVD